ncbi:hypothetical protein ACX1Q7_002397 [Enterococcus faecalis]|uniref:hypothetical protein n=1 Tax=Enterococcus TaxID=1350 RepID=UPI0019EDF821|nr:hypothetical protein [Enterococcus faecalis]EGO9445246.1 hypothetical protein [Enterococcus faecalis]MCU9795460.1 hypothetical protein [Enterococcus faecalis]
MLLYIVQKYKGAIYVEDSIIFYDKKLMEEYIKEKKDSELYTYRGIIINPFLTEDVLMKFNFSIERDILALHEEFKQIVKPEYRFLSDKLFYKVCPFIINWFS